jgi:hypothetical protein
LKRACIFWLTGLALAGCKPNPDYCDEKTPCADPAKVCLARANLCVPGGSGGGGDLGAGVDMALIPCTDSTACTSGAPTCMQGLCASCKTPGPSPDCARFAATPLCGPAGACVECLGKSDCAAAGKTCDLTMNACTPCSAHSQCTSRVCEPGGVCAPLDQVLYVDNHGEAIADCHQSHMLADGKSLGTAFCDVVDALAAQPPPKFVVVVGSVAPYSAIAVNALAADVTVTLVGPGRGATPTAALSTPNMAAVELSAGAGHFGSLDLEGLELVGSNLAGADGVDCASVGGVAELRVRDCRVHGSGGVGVSANKCSVIVDRSLIDQNLGGGLALGGASDYDLENSFIVENLATGVKIDAAASGVLAFVTVAQNGAPGGGGGAAGVDCGGGTPKRIDDSIVTGNAVDPTSQSQFFGHCELGLVVTGPGETAAGAVTVAPQFVNVKTAPFDFHLVAGSLMNHACCVDRVTSAADGGAPLPDHDVDDTHRPLGKGWDVGAHEVE